MRFVLLIISGLLLSLSLKSCTKSSRNLSVVPERPVTDTIFTIDTSRRISFLALGDSYTIGQSVDASMRFPAQTAVWLRQKGLNVLTPQYIATTGWTTANLEQAIASAALQSPYQLVTLLIGVNDQYQGVDTATYRVRFTKLLQTAIRLTGDSVSHVFVLSIPDYSVTPFAGGSNRERIAREIDYFNAINKQITQLYHCNYLDITASTREAAQNSSLLANDGLHPSGIEYRKWAERLGAMMRTILL